MPLRLTISEATLSGHEYDDVLGVRYEFPLRYRNLVREGERFVYYRGRRRASSGVQPQAYVGTGIVGTVHSSTRDSQRLVCEIEDWCLFADPLYFKDPAGNYYESGGAQGGFYWQVGVRRLSEAVYERIVSDAHGPEPSGAPADPSSSIQLITYPSQVTREAIDEYAMGAALKEGARIWPGDQVSRLPHNNRGFDIRVGSASRVVRYVEVKGTTLPLPRFFMSEGERLFSQREAALYTLLVIHAIDLEQPKHLLFRHDGAVNDQVFGLTPSQWICEARRGSRMSEQKRKG
jgi:hypothetical protein